LPLTLAKAKLLFRLAQYTLGPWGLVPAVAEGQRFSPVGERALPGQHARQPPTQRPVLVVQMLPAARIGQGHDGALPLWADLSYRVSTLVNNPKNDVPPCVEAIR
jgi:hypothetical protein